MGNINYNKKICLENYQCASLPCPWHKLFNSKTKRVNSNKSSKSLSLDQHAPQLKDLARLVPLLPQTLIPLTYSTFQPDPLLTMLMEDHQDQSDHHSHKLIMFNFNLDQHALPKRDHAKQEPLLTQLLIPLTSITSQPDLLSTMLMEDLQDQSDHHSHKLSMSCLSNNPDQLAPPRKDHAKLVLLLTQQLIPHTSTTSQLDLLSTMLMEDHQDQLDHHSLKPLTFNSRLNLSHLATLSSVLRELLPLSSIKRSQELTQWTTLFQTSVSIKKWLLLNNIWMIWRRNMENGIFRNQRKSIEITKSQTSVWTMISLIHLQARSQLQLNSVLLGHQLKTPTVFG